MDNWLIDLMKNNIITVWAILQLLKGIAILTPTVKDDKIVTMLQNIYWSIRERKVEKENGNI